MRVLHVVTRDQRRGAEVDAVHITELLATVGVESTVRALAPSPGRQASLGVTPLGPTPLHPVTLRALRREAENHDVVVAHGSATLPACRLGLIGSSTPFVYRTIGYPRAWANTALRRRRVSWMLKGALAVAALGEGSRRDIVETYGLAPSQVVVVGCTQSEEHFRPPDHQERARARRSLGVPADAPVAVMLAALSPEKRVGDAIAAAAAARDVVLLVAGDGPSRPALEDAVPPQAARRIRLLGLVQDVRPVLHAADVALLTSETEGLPGALVQAGLCGLPAVATDVGYTDEVVLDGITGRLVQVGDVDAVVRGILEALQRGADWGPAAREHCTRAFSGSLIRERWHALLATALT